MHVDARAIIPVIILLLATLWTFVDFWLHPIRDTEVLPWPARRCLYEGLVVTIVWIATSTLYWQAFRWGIIQNGVGAGLGWSLATLYWSTALRQRGIEEANRDR